MHANVDRRHGSRRFDEQGLVADERCQVVGTVTSRC